MIRCPITSESFDFMQLSEILSGTVVRNSFEKMVMCLLHKYILSFLFIVLMNEIVHVEIIIDDYDD